MKSKRKTIWKKLIPVCVTLAVLLLFRLVLMIGYVPSESMEPSLKKGSFILGARLYGELEPGDIVIFRHEGKLLVKRIAFIEGERVEHDGVSLTVPQGCYYMLGDNADNSYDSRYWSEPFVPREDIAAKLLLG